jgi:hypothetical protein
MRLKTLDISFPAGMLDLNPAAHYKARNLPADGWPGRGPITRKTCSMQTFPVDGCGLALAQKGQAPYDAPQRPTTGGRTREKDRHAQPTD